MDRARRLAAILFTDIVGYTALMQENEEQAIRALSLHREAVEELVVAYRGEVRNFYGDGSLSLFQSVADALSCARDIQLRLRKAEPVVPLRIGLHIGEIGIEGEKVFGDGVNVASRIESSGHAGLVLLSRDAWRKVRNRPDFQFQPLGQFLFKNVGEPVELFGLLDERLPKPDPASLKNRLPKAKKWYQQPWSIALLLLLPLISLVLLWPGLFSAPNEPPDAETSRVVVFPFSVQGNDQLDYLREGMVDLFSTKLDGMPGFQALDPNIVIANSREHSPQRSSPAELYQQARRWGANRFILGSLIQLGENIRIQISEYENGTQPISSAELVLQDENELLEGIDQLVRETIARNLERKGQETEALATLTGGDIAALRSFLQGEAERRSGRYEAASEKYTEALSRDSTLAMAWLRLGQACGWTGICPLPRFEVFEKAYRYRGALPPKLQEYTEAMVGFYNLKQRDHEKRFRQLILKYGENVDFLVGLGEVLYHNNQNKGRMASEAVPYFLKAWEYDPNNVEVVEHLVQLLAYARDEETLGRIMKRIPSSSDNWYFFRGIYLLAAPEPWTDEDLQAILDHPKFDWDQMFNNCHIETLVSRFIEMKKDLERLRGEVFPPARSAPIQSIIYIWQGKESASWRELEKSLQFWAAPYLLPINNMEDGVNGFSEQLEPLIDQFETGKNEGPLPDDFVLALVSLQEGRIDTYRDHRSALGKLKTISDQTRVFLLNCLEAFHLRDMGQYQRSNTRLDSLLSTMPHPVFIAASRFLEGAFLIAKAENNFDLGNYDGALELYEARFNVMNAGDEQLLGYSLRRRAEIASRAGQLEKALEYYRRFLELYRECDPKYQPWVDKAQRDREELLATVN